MNDTTRILRALIEGHMATAKALQKVIDQLEEEASANDEAERRQTASVAPVLRQDGYRNPNATEAAVHRRFASASHVDSLCTVQEAAAIICVSRTKFYQLVADGTFGVVKIGRSTRIRRSDLDRLIGSALAG